jgi:hypothetical protein
MLNLFTWDERRATDECRARNVTRVSTDFIFYWAWRINSLEFTLRLMSSVATSRRTASTLRSFIIEWTDS